MRPQANCAPEDELLLLLVRERCTPELQARTSALLGQPLSWSHILEQAQTHEVLPLLYHHLQTLDFPGVPPEVRVALEIACRMHALGNALLVRELMQILTLLGEAGVPVVPLKGVALAETLYHDITLRVCGDSDILVPRALALRAFHLLLARGYKAEFTERFFADLLLANTIECTLTRESRGFRYALDLHWGVLWGQRWDGNAAAALWTAVRPHDYFGVPAYALSPEWEFLFLATHAARHQWEGLKWLVDLHEVCSQRQIAWEHVRQETERLGWERVISLTLSACHTLFDTPISPAFPVSALPPWLRLFPKAPAPRSWRYAFFPLRLLKHPSERLHYALHVLLVPTLAELQCLRLPSPLLPLYSPLRLLRLGCKWGWRLVMSSWQRLRNAEHE